MNKKRPSIEYDYFIKTDLSKFEGQWIAIKGEKVIAHGSLCEIMKEDGVDGSLLALVPRSDVVYV